MNVEVSKPKAKRIAKCVNEMNNRVNCYETTGIHWQTVDKILERGHCRVKQLEKLLAYCDKVEGKTENTAA